MSIQVFDQESEEFYDMNEWRPISCAATSAGFPQGGRRG